MREIVTEHIDAALSGIEAFDRAEQGDHLGRLYERRLRRYLIWHLQRARALSLQNVEQAWQMLEKRLIVELAPLDGYLDERFDKLVQSPSPPPSSSSSSRVISSEPPTRRASTQRRSSAQSAPSTAAPLSPRCAPCATTTTRSSPHGPADPVISARP